MCKILIIFVLMAGIGVATNVGGCTIPPAFNNIDNSALINSAMNNQEIWKDVKGYEGSYQVSNFGRVKSLEKIAINVVYGEQRLKEKILKQIKEWTGYYHVNLYNNSIRRTHKVHRLVLTSFCSNPENKAEVNHKNGIKTDNRLENLEWVTRNENQKHAFKNGLNKPNTLGKFGKEHHCSIPVIQYTKSGEFVAEYYGQLEAKRITGISNSNIGMCCKGKYKTAGGYVWKFKK